MIWYDYSLLAMVFSAFGVVTSRWALNLGANKIKFLTLVFVGLFGCYLIYTWPDLAALFSSPKLSLYLGWGFLAALLSFFGNLAGLKANEMSPNPGYVQAITSINAILVLLLAAVIFGSPVGWPQLVGAIIIIGGMIPLMGHRTGRNKGLWQVMALLAMLSYGIMVLVIKQMGVLGFSVREVLLVLFFFGSIGFVLLYLFKARKTPSPSLKKLWLSIVIYTALAFISNLFVFTAVNLAPNAGYSSSIGNSGIILALILSTLFFKKDEGGEFNLVRWLGAGLIVLGAVLTII